jgi:hypothetical protein
MSSQPIRIMDLTEDSPILDTAIVSSRMYLVLERLVGTKDYVTQGTSTIRTAIAIFEQISSESAKELAVRSPVEQAFTMLKQEGFLADEMTLSEFCEQSIDTLGLLLNTPKKVSENRATRLKRFFSLLQSVITESALETQAVAG